MLLIKCFSKRRKYFRLCELFSGSSGSTFKYNLRQVFSFQQRGFVYFTAKLSFKESFWDLKFIFIFALMKVQQELELNDFNNLKFAPELSLVVQTKQFLIKQPDSKFKVPSSWEKAKPGDWGLSRNYQWRCPKFCSQNA